jgi:transcriptional regulator with XRE-family HTH domain
MCARETDAQRPSARHTGDKLRAARGLSQEALAHECGLNRTYLSGVERSERNISIDNIARIAKGLGVEPWKLLRAD